MSVAVFWILALVGLLSAVLVFRLASMARVTYALLAVFLCVGGQLILLGLGYLGVVVILMMVMEMVIMGAFMVAYMMNPAGLMPMSMAHNKRTAAMVSASTFAVLAGMAFAAPWPRRTGVRPVDSTRQLGALLMGGQMLTMIVIGLVLFAAMVSATVLATARGRYDRFGDDLKRPTPNDPILGGIDQTPPGGAPR